MHQCLWFVSPALKDHHGLLGNGNEKKQKEEESRESSTESKSGTEIVGNGSCNEHANNNFPLTLLQN